MFKSHDPINPNPITPYMVNSGDMQNSGEFNTIVLDSNTALKEENEPVPIDLYKKKSLTVKISNIFNHKQSTSSSTPIKEKGIYLFYCVIINVFSYY